MKKSIIFLFLFTSLFLFGKSPDYLTGRINPSKDPSFVEVEETFSKGKGYYLNKEAYQAFLAMAHAAKKDKVKLSIVSAFRSFHAQKTIWEEKWDGRRKVEGKNLSQEIKDFKKRAKTILRYSSMPGTSRHHWGTDMDFNSVNPDFFEGKEGKKIYQWLKSNASKYGFCQPYTAFGEGRQNGYQEEKWHWSYQPLSKEFLRQYIEKYKDEDLQGFKGAETAKELQIIKNYVEGINPSCK